MNGGELCLIDGTEDGLANGTWEEALDLQKESSEECWKDHSIANSLDHLMEFWKAQPDGTTLGVMLGDLYGLLLGPVDGKLDGVLEGILDEWR